jgi:hypothetical protein
MPCRSCRRRRQAIAERASIACPDTFAIRARASASSADPIWSALSANDASGTAASGRARTAERARRGRPVAATSASTC